MTQRVAVVGAGGRLGRVVIGAIEADPRFEAGPLLGRGDDLARLAEADLVVDATAPQASADVVAAAVGAGRPVLVGTSGWNEARVQALRGRLGGDVSVLIVPNFSVGAVLAGVFAEQAARWFDSVEIVEAHHAGKSDSPSGTAVRTAERIAAARADLGPVAAPHADQRARGQQVDGVPVHSLRMAGVQARQQVHFGGLGEVLTIAHETTDAIAYTAGIRLALGGLTGMRGIVVGLESLLLGTTSTARAGVPAVADRPHGQAAAVDRP